VIYNGLLYTVEVATQIAASLAEQTQEVLALIEKNLSANSSNKQQILSATIYLADIRKIDEFNQVWEQWLPAGYAPVRACVEAKLAKPDLQVEIQIIAAVTPAASSGVRFMT
jgi:enamine deaminase RidA (YjgF/YER057c/UK114 family)